MNRNAENIISTGNVTADRLDMQAFADRQIEASVLRLDKIHPVVSGNKWFKLKYHLQKAVEAGYTSVLTFGGAWSNHIVATACASHAVGLSSVGIIRGGRPKNPSSTLVTAENFGMRLRFTDRSEYVSMQLPQDRETLHKKFPGNLVIPEGGGGIDGIRGCEEILSLVERERYTHVICAIGTGTMFCGLANSSVTGQQVIGIPVLKGMENLLEQYRRWIDPIEKINDCKVFTGYHFGGYAKKNAELIGFMNSFFRQTLVPTDFVYTGKLFYAVLDLLKKDYFPASARLLVIHSGGLQGNASLPKGELLF